MSILNMPCTDPDCDGEICSGVHLYQGGDWPFYLVLAAVIVFCVVMTVLEAR